jgi:hypothetical protein
MNNADRLVGKGPGEVEARSSPWIKIRASSIRQRPACWANACPNHRIGCFFK